MTAAARARRTWVLRLLGLALVAAVLVTQVRWHDALQTTDGRTLTGRVCAEEGGWRVEEAGDPSVAHHVAPGDVARRGRGTGEVPAITWGIRSLAVKLARRPAPALEVLLLLFATWWLTAWRWQGLLRAVDVRLGLGTAVRLNLVGAFFNTAVPGATGGDVVKAWYAAKATQRGVRAVLSVFADRLIGLLGLAVFAAGALLLLPSRAGLGAAKVIVAVVLSGLLVVCAVLLSGRLRRWLGLGHLARRLPFHAVLAELAAALRLYKERPRALALALGISLLNHAIAAVAVYLLAGALGIEGLDLPTVLALEPVANLFGAVPLLPGGWGVGEVAFAYLFGLVGIPATEAVGLSVVYRLCMLVVSLPGGLVWLTWRGRPSREAIQSEVHAAQEVVQALEDQAEAAEDLGAAGAGGAPGP